MKILTSAKAVLSSRFAKVAVLVSAPVAAIAAGTMAGATGSYDPTSGLTTFANTVGTTAGPIVIAVASALVGLALLFWGIKFAFSFIGTRARAK